MAETQALNIRGEWVPSIPLPYYLAVRKRCACGRKFWTAEGYEAHYALVHILALRPPVTKPCFRCGKPVSIGKLGMLMRPDGSRSHDCNEDWMAKHGYADAPVPSGRDPGGEG